MHSVIMTTQSERAWWKQGTKTAFVVAIRKLPQSELEALSSEIKGALASIQGQIEGSDRDDDWFARATMARGHIAERKALVTAELQRRNDNARVRKSEVKARAVERARTFIRSGQLERALDLMLDMMEGKIYDQGDIDS